MALPNYKALAALPLSAQVDQKQALILQALKNKSQIDCPSVIKNTNELERLTDTLPAALYYYRSDCLYKSRSYVKAYKDLETYFSSNKKKDKIYEKALLLHSQVEKEYMHIEKQKKLDPLRGAAVRLHDRLCGLDIRSKWKATFSDNRDMDRLKVTKCKPDGRLSIFSNGYLDAFEDNELGINYRMYKDIGLASIGDIKTYDSQNGERCFSIDVINQYMHVGSWVYSFKKSEIIDMHSNLSWPYTSVTICPGHGSHDDEISELIAVWNSFNQQVNAARKNALPYEAVLQNINNIGKYFPEETLPDDTRFRIPH